MESTQTDKPSERYAGSGEGPLWVTLDLVALLNDYSTFSEASMALCNELAFHLKATRVSLGWMRDDAARLAATSHTNKLDKRLEAVRDLERVMEEAADQDEDIIYPPSAQSATITREHENYARKLGSRHLLSIPLRADGKVKAVLTLQRESRAFAPEEVNALRLVADLTVRRLEDLRRYGRGWWRRRETRAREWLASFLGADYTWWKLGGIAGALLLAFLCFFPWPYRISGDFTLKTQALINLPAPFDGYIESVAVIPGDPVVKEQDLVGLDTRELELQEKEALANRQRFRSESQLAMGQGNVSEMHAAAARAAQAEAELMLTRSRLARAELRSPFDGIVVEGALLEQLGAPVRKGDVLMKVTRLEDLYVQVKISEKDIDQIDADAVGQFAFASRPEEKFDLQVDRVEPAAIPEEKDNVFQIRCQIAEDVEEWWRPGMTGVAKIDAGHRPPIYLMTHRLIDFIRLKLWL